MENHIKTVGFFGGTFDPLHFGHLNLAVEMLEKAGLDQVWFCPARLNPHKQEEPPTPISHRLAMLQLALADNPRFRLLELEASREGPSYTFDTLHELMEQEKLKPHPMQFKLILGEDALAGFFRWHRVVEIVQLVPLLIGSRSGFPTLETSKSPPAIYDAIQKGLIPTRHMEISATEVRRRLQQGLYCRHLLPKEVLDYIKSHRLY